ncbi:unnamed protein product [Eruca vesicaria subsp. sativa]|uniref:Uncharacterized protein n=1 Tax=Eruca vesicaria subsp. sativa TaxID=29727 RepID=A0ABC8KJI0_ERUVS|nr:unnamed protein product [Eruca vesicaria subsp. sativa]
MRLSLVLLLLPVSLAVVSAQFCLENFGTFRPGSNFDKNRQLILSSLASEVTSNDGLFNGSIGKDPDQVYAMGMCIPGAKQEICSDCIKAASDQLIQSCPNQAAAFYWSGAGETLCMARYSSEPSFRPLDMDSPSYGANIGNLSTNLTYFDELLERLSVRMVTEVSSSGKNVPVSSSRFYAADVAALTSSINVYALMQCTPDVSPSNCNTCLRQSIDDYVDCCRGKQGGYVYWPNCIFRWDLYPYNGAFDHIKLVPQPTSQPTSQPASQPASQLQSPPPLTNKDGKTIGNGAIIGIVLATLIIILALLALGVAFCRSRQKYKAFSSETADDIATAGYLQFDIKEIEAATSNFLATNKIGQGGFGVVYKGTLPNGTEVAVKRLSRNSDQGEMEFKNEVLLVAKLQHRNLVRLLGFSLQGEEKILVYEFVPNKSLDYFLFDPTKKGQLDWTRRYNIIGGITRGILYLHQDSRLTIIHRDIKASNILLDADMNPKIADFGMARNFRDHQTEANTGRVVGTFGYMSPEYVTHGLFSTKSDVYSFGVLILEIVSGKKNSSFYQRNSVCNLVTYGWKLWNSDSALELIDPTVGENYEKDEVFRCIHIGLLCVQEAPSDRPAMSTVFQMLTNSSIILPVPRPPGFFFRNKPNLDPLTYGSEPGESSSKSVPCSINDATITAVTPR